MQNHYYSSDKLEGPVRRRLKQWEQSRGQRQGSAIQAETK